MANIRIETGTEIDGFEVGELLHKGGMARLFAVTRRGETMPMLINHIDAIARKKGRDVVFIDFPQEESEDPFAEFDVDWNSLPIRKQIIAWLEQNRHHEHDARQNKQPVKSIC